MLKSVKSRLFNVHSLSGVGVALAAFGFVTPHQVDAVNSAVGGDPFLGSVGIALIVIAKLLRKS